MTQLTHYTRRSGVCLGCQAHNPQYGCDGDIDRCISQAAAVYAPRTFVSPGDPVEVTPMAARVGYTLPVMFGPKLMELITEIPSGHWDEHEETRLADVLQSGLTALALAPEGTPYNDLPFTARLSYQVDDDPTVYQTIRSLLSYDLAPDGEELSITISLAHNWKPPTRDLWWCPRTLRELRESL